MLSHLNGWERIGSVATVLWLCFMLVLGAMGLDGKAPFGKYTMSYENYTYSEIECSEPWPKVKPGEATLWRLLEEGRSCPPGATVIKPRERIKTTTVPEKYEFFLESFLLFAFVLPTLLWLLSYAAVKIVRWVAAGFSGGAT